MTAISVDVLALFLLDFMVSSSFACGRIFHDL